MRLKRFALSTVVVAALNGLPAHALDGESRLRLAGEFIGAHARIYAVGTQCNYAVDGLYGPEVALNQMKPLLSADEFATLDAYLASTEFTQSLGIIRADISETRNTLITTQGQTESQACATLIERAIAQHREVNARLKDLH